MIDAKRLLSWLKKFHKNDDDDDDVESENEGYDSEEENVDDNDSGLAPMLMNIHLWYVKMLRYLMH